MRPQIRTVEGKIARLAANSHGVVSRDELLRAGVTQAQIKSRIARGFLLPIHRGVFWIGHTATNIEARYLAAVKACGPGSLLAGRAAAHLLGLLKRTPSLPEVRTTHHRRPSGVTVRRCRQIDSRDRTECRGVPVTNVPRTLVELAAALEPPDLARAFHEAVVKHHIKPEAVERVLRRRHNWPGARELRRVIWGGEPVSLSKLESSFIAVLRRAPVPLPRTNIPVGKHYVDCRRPEHRLTVELDSYRYHGTGTPGNWTSTGSARRAHAATSAAATRGATSRRSPSRCSRTCGRYSADSCRDARVRRSEARRNPFRSRRLRAASALRPATGAS